MKVAIALLLAIVLALAWLLSAEVATNSQQRSQLAELTSKLGDKTASENLELQQKCQLQAEKVFRQQGFKLNEPNGNSASFQSHYNAKLNKCFMTVDSTSMTTVPVTQFVNRFLFDAYEQREYAEYMWMSSNSKKYWEVPPKICKLIPSSATETLCKSEEEYKVFVARYME